jgi:hypothetical protein
MEIRIACPLEIAILGRLRESYTLEPAYSGGLAIFTAIRRAFNCQNRRGRDTDGYSDLCTASRHSPRPKFRSLALCVKPFRSLPVPAKPPKRPKDAKVHLWLRLDAA